ncbi:MAG: hypothetical protein ACRELB_01210 [Polyangiaceae bacterium]
MGAPRRSPLEAEVARLRKEVAVLEAELASYQRADGEAVARALGGTVVAVVIAVAASAIVIALYVALTGAVPSCASGGPHHGQQAPP